MTKAKATTTRAARPTRPKAPREQLNLRVPPALREAIRVEAFTSGTNVNDLCVGILAARFGVPFSPSGRTSVPTGGSS